MLSFYCSWFVEAGCGVADRSYELPDGGLSAEFSVEEHEVDGFMETEFYMSETFPTHGVGYRGCVAGWTKED